MRVTLLIAWLLIGLGQQLVLQGDGWNTGETAGRDGSGDVHAMDGGSEPPPKP